MAINDEAWVMSHKHMYDPYWSVAEMQSIGVAAAARKIPVHEVVREAVMRYLSEIDKGQDASDDKPIK